MLLTFSPKLSTAATLCRKQHLQLRRVQLQGLLMCHISTGSKSEAAHEEAFSEDRKSHQTPCEITGGLSSHPAHRLQQEQSLNVVFPLATCATESVACMPNYRVQPVFRLNATSWLKHRARCAPWPKVKEPLNLKIYDWSLTSCCARVEESGTWMWATRRTMSNLPTEGTAVSAHNPSQCWVFHLKHKAGAAAVGPSPWWRGPRSPDAPRLLPWWQFNPETGCSSQKSSSLSVHTLLRYCFSPFCSSNLSKIRNPHRQWCVRNAPRTGNKVHEKVAKQQAEPGRVLAKTSWERARRQRIDSDRRRLSRGGRRNPVPARTHQRTQGPERTSPLDSESAHKQTNKHTHKLLVTYA